MVKKRYHNGLYYTVEIIIGISILWALSILIKEKNFMSWSIIAFLGTLERDVRYRKILLRQRFTHTLIAGFITAMFLMICGPGYLSFVLSLFFSMVCGNIFTGFPAGWKVIPITSGVLNYLAMIISQTSYTTPTLLIILRVIETAFGAFLAIIIQVVYIKTFKQTPPQL